MKTYIQHSQLRKYQELTSLQLQTVLISSMKYTQLPKEEITNITLRESIGGNTQTETMNGIRENLVTLVLKKHSIDNMEMNS